MKFVRAEIFVTLVVIAAGVVSCKSAPVATSNSASNTTAPTSLHSLPFDRLHSGANSGYTKLSEFVIRDGDEFTRRWRGVLQGAPDAEKPEINFEKTTVVFVAIGSRNTGGYTVRVDSVARESGGAIVYYTVSSPGSRCMSLQELTSPIEVISLDRLDGNIIFKKRSVTGAC